MSIDFSSRDLRETALYREIEDHFLRLHQPAFGQVSHAADPDPHPGGDRIAFTGTVLTELAGQGITRVCLAESGSVRILTDGPGQQSRPRFSPDGNLLAYLSDAGRPGDNQLRIVDLLTGTELPAGAVDGTVEYVSFSPDGRRVLLAVAGHGADRSGGEGSGTTASIDDVPAWMPEVRAGPAADEWRSAWVADVDTGETRRVSPAGLNTWELVWAGPDAVLAVTSDHPGEEAWYSAELNRIELGTGEIRHIHRSDRQLGWPSSTPSGERVAVVSAICSDRWVVAGDLYVLDGDKPAVHIDTSGVDVTYTQWLDEDRLGFMGLRGLETVAGVYHHSADKVEEIWGSSETTGDRYPYGRFLGDGSVAGVWNSYRRYPELAFLGADEVHTVASLRHPGADYLTSVAGESRSYKWTAPDGLHIEGVLCTPSREGPFPLVVMIHGGPVWAHRDHWSMFWAYTPLLVSRGYAVLHPNPRGSGGRGQAFAEAVFGDMGGADTYDFLSGIDALVEHGIADPSRIGVTGASYGGFMSAWLVTQDQRFAAAVPMAPVTDWCSQHHTTNIPYFDELFLGDRPRASRGRYAERSPLLFADEVTTPTLLTAGANDRCTPPTQAVEFYTALRERGVDTAVVVYPEEGHGVRNFPALIDQCTRMVGWFERYMPADN
jgi:dipeptidyl aminopeptidase/acylaminoacyl peptidase